MIIFQIYINDTMHQATTDIHQHQDKLDSLHAMGYEPIEKRVKRNGN